MRRAFATGSSRGSSEIIDPGIGRRWAGLVRLLTAAVMLAQAVPANAQRESIPVDLPDRPSAEGFDNERFDDYVNGWFETCHVETTEALEAARAVSETRLLVIETAAGRLAFLQDQMARHHLSQGQAGGKDWMATF